MDKTMIGKIVAWLAILCAVVGLFWQATIMAGAAIALAVIGFLLRASVNQMSLTAALIAVAALVIDMISY